jgi:hypothetical protein
MATTHLYSNFPNTDWSVPMKTRHMWVYTGLGATGWSPLINQWGYDGVAWQRGYTTVPGPLDHIELQYDTLTCNAGDSLHFNVVGVDNDDIPINLSGDTIQWTVSTDTESITSDGGDNTRATLQTGFPGGHTTQVTVSVFHGGTWWSDSVTVLIN